MSMFIIAHAYKNNERVMIAIRHITVVTPLEGYTRIYTDDHDYTDITEDFDTVLEVINKAYIP